MGIFSKKAKKEAPSSPNTSTSDVKKEDVETQPPSTTAVQDHNQTPSDSQTTVGANEPFTTEAIAIGEKMDKVKTSDTEDHIVYPTGIKLVLILVALCLSVFLVALDQTIIATAIPKMYVHVTTLPRISASEADNKQYGPLQVDSRYRLVWQFVSIDYYCFTTYVWQDIHNLQHQVDFHYRHQYIRTWVCSDRSPFSNNLHTTQYAIPGAYDVATMIICLSDKFLQINCVCNRAKQYGSDHW